MKNKMIVVRIREDIYKEYKIIAEKSYTTSSSLIHKALNDFLPKLKEIEDMIEKL